MPTVLRTGPFRFSFFNNENNEPPHIHVHAGGNQAKYWLDPIVLERNYGFNLHELRKIKSIIEEHQGDLLGEWNDYFENTI